MNFNEFSIASRRCFLIGINATLLKGTGIPAAIRRPCICDAGTTPRMRNLSAYGSFLHMQRGAGVANYDTF